MWRHVLSRRGLVVTAAVATVVLVTWLAGEKESFLPNAERRAAQRASVDTWQPPIPVEPDGGCPVVDPMDARDAGAVTRFVAIGDYGSAGPVEQTVAELVLAARPEFILTLGDNNYPLGEASTIDFNIGLFYHSYIAPYVGRFGCGAVRNRFFPSLGNHDWYTSGARPYLDYFTLPGNERYYDVAWGDVHLFALDTDPNEPDGVTEGSRQARWLERGLADARERWKIVYFHHPPYSSGPHGSTASMRWPFRRWGADLVLSGHDHVYEHVVVDGLDYLVNGLGGATFYSLGAPVEGSVTRFNEAAGALFFEADARTLRARFRTIDGRDVDTVVLGER
jgi:hypothetical protein